MSDWNLINKHRCREGRFWSEDSDSFNGLFTIQIDSETLNIIASDGEGWKHVSVSRKYDSHKVPSWSMMCKVKELFFEPEDWVVQFHPAQSEYVNNHAGCLHLWKQDAPFPTPPSILTGIKPGHIRPLTPVR